MNKMRFETTSLPEANLEKLASLFPDVITEGTDRDGNPKRGVDFQKLRQLLEPDLLAEGRERYEFTWPGKREAAIEAGRPVRKTLRPCPEESLNWDTTQNIYIEGDNLDALKLLQESYLGKVKMIYIDPPYNTGNDFIYRDKYAIGKDDYEELTGAVEKTETGEKKRYVKNQDSNGRFHSDWCSMIYPRLLLARNLLSEDGVIFISIDENEAGNLKKICDEIYSPSNYIGDIVWESTTQPINTGTAKFGLQKKTETILFYAKKKKVKNTFNVGLICKENVYPHNGKFGKCRFEIIEKSDAGTFSRPTMRFKILGRSPREGKRWQIGRKTAEDLVTRGRIEIVDDIVKKAVYPEDEEEKAAYKPFWSLLPQTEVGTAQAGKEELNQLLGNIGFDTVKPTLLIEKLISYLDDDAIVLDFFSGSATTAHAVMQLNAEDGGSRRFIMVQLPEVCAPDTGAAKAGFANICEIGKERIRRAGAKIREANAGRPGNLDTGFRVFKCDSSNMRDVFYAPGATEQATLDAAISNIKPDRTEEDLLFACLLEWGLPLSLPYKRERICGFDAHLYDYENEDGIGLVACFNPAISLEALYEIAKLRPVRAVFRDASFAISETKENAARFFKHISPATNVRII